MTAGPQAGLLPDGRRLHLHHGPIDLIIDVSDDQREAAFGRATLRFSTLLGDLVRELPALRRPLDGGDFSDPVARRMARAVAPYAPIFVTPMARPFFSAASPLSTKWLRRPAPIPSPSG